MDVADPSTMSHLLALPRELRDLIYRFAAEQERMPYQLKCTAQPYDGVHLKSSLPIISACRQLHAEYSEVLQQWVVAPPLSQHPHDRTGPCNALQADVQNMKFDGLVHFLGQLGDDLENFRMEDKLYVVMRFNSASNANRTDLLRWLRFCRESNIQLQAQNYVAPHFLNYESRTRSKYVHIYDLFSIKTGDEHEESIFQVLQGWYALRNYRLPARCGTGRRKCKDAEKACAMERGLRKYRSAAQCESWVRPSSPPM